LISQIRTVPLHVILTPEQIQVNQFQLKLKTVFQGGDIFYKLCDNAEFQIYKTPIPLHKKIKIWYYSIEGDSLRTPILTKEIYPHSALGIIPNFLQPFSVKYSASGIKTLTDGELGSDEYFDKKWLGYSENDLETEINFTTEISVNEISIRFFQSLRAWIFFPEWVEFYGKTSEGFQLIKRIDNQYPDKENSVNIQTFQIQLEKAFKTNAIRIKGKNIGKCPSWHHGAGGKAWIFCDEIFINPF